MASPVDDFAQTAATQRPGRTDALLLNVKPIKSAHATPASSPGEWAVYHIYPKRLAHCIISPTVIERKERMRPRRKPMLRIRLKHKDIPTAAAESVGWHTADEEIEGAFFVHKPYLSFHHPPRTLRRGDNKQGAPICIIHNSWFWQMWKLQFGRHIPEAIDGRGVIGMEHSGTDSDDLALKGYRVRSWRLWGESGKAYHRQINEERTALTSTSEKTSTAKVGTSQIESTSITPVVEVKDAPLRADEAVILSWTAPLSRATRRYDFHYAGTNFSWRGSGAFRFNGKWAFIVRYNHLKLMASPATSTAAGTTSDETCLARYTSSPNPQKYGALWIHDAAVQKIVNCSSSFAKSNSQNRQKKGEKEYSEEDSEENVKQTRLYEIIVATGVAMLLAEKQKRELLKEVIIALLSEGGSNGGG